jgi:hypothetical protein
MTTDARDRNVEHTLQDAFSFGLSDETRRSIDRRVEAAAGAERLYRPAAPRRRLGVLTPRIFGGLAAAMLLLAASAVAGGTLFSHLITGAPLLENIWDRATDVGESVTDAGYTVTLEKVAVDHDRVWVALAVGSDTGGADIWDMRVTDANGVVFTGGTGAGGGDVGGERATLFGFQVPEGVTPTGPFVLEVTALDVKGVKTPGTWRFTFDALLTPAWSHSPVQMTPVPAAS